MCPPKVAQQRTSPPRSEGARSTLTASPAHSGPGALVSWRRHPLLPPPTGGEPGAPRGCTRRGHDLCAREGGRGPSTTARTRAWATALAPITRPYEERYRMGQRASVAFLRSLVACCDKRGARAGRQARAVGDTPRSPPAHVVPGGAASPVRGLPVVAPTEARPLEGSGAPGGRRRRCSTARLSQDCNTPRKNVTARGGHVR